MSDDIRAKAQAVLYGTEGRDAYAGDLARHLLDTEHRLDVALRGALQSREEMREWLGSDEVSQVIQETLYGAADDRYISDRAARVLAALIAALPGADL